MCMCGKPTINGEPGYSWDGKARGKCPVRPPDIRDDDELIYDEPGRCGGLDSHCHHVRLVKRLGRLTLLVRNGGGDHEVRIPHSFELSGVLDGLDSNGRYWLLLSLYNVHQESTRRSVRQDVRDVATSRCGKANQNPQATKPGFRQGLD